MKSTQEQIKEIFNKHFQKYSSKLNFIENLGCNSGMCLKFNNNRKFIYQFLPTPIPKSLTEYIFICKEPSIQWAVGTTDAFNKVINYQYMNFISAVRKNNKLDILISAFRNVYGDKPILITDMSKCAIDLEVADDFGFKDNLVHRYECCSPYLKWEIENLAVSNPNVFIVGKNYFFMEWYKRKFPESNNDEANNIICFEKFLNKTVDVNITTERIFMLPHYSIRFSCPDYILRMLRKDKLDIQKEINDGLIKLYHYYLDNFILTKNIEESIKSSLSNSVTADAEKELSDSVILLYLLYKNEFEIARDQWEKTKS